MAILGQREKDYQGEMRRTDLRGPLANVWAHAGDRGTT